MDCERIVFHPAKPKAAYESSSYESNIASASWANGRNGQNSVSSEAVSDHDLHSGSGKETVCKAVTSFQDPDDAFQKCVKRFESAETQIMGQKDQEFLDENMSCISSSQEGTHNSCCDGDWSDEMVHNHPMKKGASISALKSFASEICSLKLCYDAALTKCLKEVDVSLPNKSTTETDQLCGMNQEDHARDIGSNSNKKQVGLQSTSSSRNHQSGSMEIEVNICDICGDLGYEKFLVICSKCGDGAEHIYCMRVKMKEVPKCNWLCEECRTKEAIQNQQRDESENGAWTPVKELLNTGTFSHGLSLNVNEEGLDSKMDLKKKANNHVDMSPIGGSKKPTAAKWRLLQDRKKRKRFSTSVGNSVSLVPLTSSISALEGSLSRSPSDVTVWQQPSSHFLGLDALKSVPQPDFIWQGRIKLKGSQNCSVVWDGIQAHLSNSASLSFTKVACRFPQILKVEEVPLSAVWSTLFPGPIASAADVALYFFAKDLVSYDRSCKVLTEHLIENVSCLVGDVHGYSFFIFSSKTLPEGSWCWNGFLYLWGVLRCKNAPLVDDCGSKFVELPLVDLLKEYGSEPKSVDEGGNQTKRITSSGEPELEDGPNLELSLGLAGSKRRKLSIGNETSNDHFLSLSLAATPVRRKEMKLLQSMCPWMDGSTEMRDVNTCLSLLR